MFISILNLFIESSVTNIIYYYLNTRKLEISSTAEDGWMIQACKYFLVKGTVISIRLCCLMHALLTNNVHVLQDCTITTFCLCVLCLSTMSTLPRFIAFVGKLLKLIFKFM